MKYLPFFLLFVCFCQSLSGQQPVLLNDFNQDGEDAFRLDPEINGMQAGALFYFTAETAEHGEELYRTNGTTLGTQLIKDIRPGEAASSIRFIGAMGDTVFFAASDGEHGYELWMSRGTATSTRMVTDLNEGSGSGISSSSQTYVWFNGTLFFSGNGGTGSELYRTRGTEETTQLIKDINPNTTGSGLHFSGSPRKFTAARDFIYFEANNGEHGRELWRSDGTTEGTVMVADISPGTASTTFGDMLTGTNALVFVADDGEHGKELWISTGTAQFTYMVRDMTPGPEGTDIDLLGITRNFLYFTVKDGVFRNLWRSNGNPDNVEQVLDDNNNPIRVRGTAFQHDGELLFVANNRLWTTDREENDIRVAADVSPEVPLQISVMQDELYFAGSQGTDGNAIWKTDGTPEGTEFIALVTDASYREVQSLVASGRNLYMIGESSEFGRELWISDGTSDGTHMLIDGREGPEDSYRSFEDVSLIPFDNQLLFVGYDDAHGYELWRSQGSPESTQLVKDINTQTKGIILYSPPVDFQGSQYFTTSDGLWQTDGTSAGTQLIWEGEIPDGLNVFNGSLFFTARAPGINRTIWVSDGTEAGTQMLWDSTTASTKTILFQEQLPQVNGYMFFIGNEQGSNYELWRTDGTPDGTQMIKDIHPTDASTFGFSTPDDYAIFENELYFRATDGTLGAELWKTDGTDAGTQPVADINPFGGSNPSHFALLGSQLLFSATDGTGGYELWRSDGTADGTRIVQDLFHGEEDGYRNPEYVVQNGILYFTGESPEHGEELWRSDGTLEGTFRVDSDDPDKSISSIRGLTTYKGKLFFNGVANSVRYLFSSDGTVAGTQAITTVGVPSDIWVAANRLFFSNEQPETGRELWMSDGTVDGTRMVADLFPGINDASPRVQSFIDNTLFFTATDQVHGNELWAVRALGMDVQIRADQESLCDPEEPISFTADIVDGGDRPLVQWFRNGQPMAEATLPTIERSGLANGDEIQVRVIAGNDVWVLPDTVFSDVYTVAVEQLEPEITISGDQLIATEGSQYRWYLDGELLSSTTQVIDITQSGSYQVEILTENGCSYFSNPVNVQVTSTLDPRLVHNIRLYPNPASKWIRIDSDLPERIEVTLFSPSGKSLYRDQLLPNQHGLRISLDQWANGLYLVRLSTSQGSYVRKVVKR